MIDLNNLTVCFLGAGNLGLPILQSLVRSSAAAAAIFIKKFNVCVRSQSTKDNLDDIFADQDNVIVTRKRNALAVEDSDVVILAVDPADVAPTLRDMDIQQAFRDKKLLISVAAGWSTEDIMNLMPLTFDAPGTGNVVQVMRALPNIAAQVGESMTAIQDPGHPHHHWTLAVAEAIFKSIGKTAIVPASLIDATTAVAGSTPAFFAVICDALIDASVAVGVPRPMAQKMIYQSMLGTATMMRDGLHPGLLKDQSTSPEGCTIGGLMVLEEGALRGTLGRGLREAVTVARRMGSEQHVNDTRR